MRLIAFSIVILSGAIMVSAGEIASAIDHYNRISDVVPPGGGIIFVGCVLFVVELILGYRKKKEEGDLPGR